MALPAMAISHRLHAPTTTALPRRSANIRYLQMQCTRFCKARKRLACEAHQRCIWQVGGETGDYPASG